MRQKLTFDSPIHHGHQIFKIMTRLEIILTSTSKCFQLVAQK